MRARSWSGLLAGALVGALGIADAAAQAFPSRTVSIVVPFAAGGRADQLARLLAAELERDLGQKFLVDNRSGASGAIGSAFVAKARPDGHTLLLASSGTATILPGIAKSLPYDANADFTPVALLVESFSFLGIHPSVPAATLADFIKVARTNTNLNFASSGVGTYNHFAGEFFNLAAGTKVTHVPYRGSGPSVADLVAGHVQMMIGGEFLENAKTGQVRILATTNDERWPDLPQVPTLKEAGLPEVSLPPLWFGILGPAGMPADVVEKLNAASNKAYNAPAMREKLREAGSVPRNVSAAKFGEQIRTEQRLYKDVASSRNITAE